MLQQHLPFTVLKLSTSDSGDYTSHIRLQQHLPFTVLKLFKLDAAAAKKLVVATAPTVYGIETIHHIMNRYLLRVATAPTVYGIETYHKFRKSVADFISEVATAPTVYGIETSNKINRYKEA